MKKVKEDKQDKNLHCWRPMLTGRLRIRRFRPEDWQDLYEYLSQEVTVHYEPYEPFTVSESKAEAIKRSTDWGFWAVCLKDSDKLIGNVSLSEQGFDTWELGYVFNKNYQGKGYATEAAAAIVDHVFRQHHAHRVIANCNPMNVASWKLLVRLGMRREGLLRNNIFFKRDRSGACIWQDTYQYGILASEWSERLCRHY